MNPAWKTGSAGAGLLYLSACFFLLAAIASGQSQSNGAPSTSSASSTSQNESYSSGPPVGLPAGGAASGATQNPFLSSVPEGKATPEVLQLSFKDAIDRALKNNLGLLRASDSSLSARGEKWLELSHLLPNVSAAATQSAAQIDLAALGFRVNFPGVSPVIGPIEIGRE